MIVIRLVSGIRSHFVTRLPEWGLSSTLFAFSCLLLWVPSRSFETSAGYRLLSKAVSENTWGFISGFTAVLWLVALFVNGSFKSSRRWSPWVRSLCAFTASGIWGTNAICIFVTTPLSPGVVNNAGFAVAAFASSILTAREVGAIDGTIQRCRRQSPPRAG